MPSSVIRRFSYDETTGTLFVTFTSGELYAYFDVPRTVPEGMGRAISKGRYFSRHVRDRYPFKRMGTPTPAVPADGATPGSGSAGPASPPPAGAGR